MRSGRMSRNLGAEFAPGAVEALCGYDAMTFGGT